MRRTAEKTAGKIGAILLAFSIALVSMANAQADTVITEENIEKLTAAYPEMSQLLRPAFEKLQSQEHDEAMRCDLNYIEKKFEQELKTQGILNSSNRAAKKYGIDSASAYFTYFITTISSATANISMRMRDAQIARAPADKQEQIRAAFESKIPCFVTEEDIQATITHAPAVGKLMESLRTGS